MAAFGDGSRYGVKLNYLARSRAHGQRGRDQAAAVVLHRHVRRRRLRRSHRCEPRRAGDVSQRARRAGDDRSGRGAKKSISTASSSPTNAAAIVEFQEKPPKGTERSKLVNTGHLRVRTGDFRLHSGRRRFTISARACSRRCSRPVPGFYGMRLGSAYWRDIGTPSEYRLATEDVLAGRVRLRGARATGVPAGVRVGERRAHRGRRSAGRQRQRRPPRADRRTDGHRRQRAHRRRRGGRTLDRLGCGNARRARHACATRSSASTTTFRPIPRSSTASSRTNRSRPSSR